MASWDSNMQNKQFMFNANPDGTSDFDIDLDNMFPLDESIYGGSSAIRPTRQSQPNAMHSSGMLVRKQSATGSPNTTTTTSSSALNGAISASPSSRASFDAMSPSYLSASQPQHDWLLNPSSGEVVDCFPADPSQKRSRRENDDSDFNACWKSPLCPNKKSDGTHPDSCRGECVDYLFANPSTLPDDKKVLSDLMARSKPKISLDSPATNSRRRLKRSEMESPPDSNGRETSTELDDGEEDSPISTRSKYTSPSMARPSSFDASTPESKPNLTTQTKPKGRVPHNQVEKKYRENVNSQFEALRRALPMSQTNLAGFIGSDTFGLDIEDLAATAAARQPSKAVVLSSATAYIKMLERENQRLKEEVTGVKGQTRALQGLVSAKCDECSLMDYVKRWRIQGTTL
jgi:Helix-loop-helix DNA-binding domain